MGMTLQEALTDVNIAFLQVEFSIKLLSYCQLEKISPAEFDTDQFILLEQDNLRFPPGHFRCLEDIIRAASVTVSSAFGASALTLDKAWEIAGYRPDPKSTDEKVRLRTLVHMVRCAYAHGIACPKWEVRGDFRQVFGVKLPSALLSLDLRELHDREFDFNDLGGHARWFEIRDASIAVLSS